MGFQLKPELNLMSYLDSFAFARLGNIIIIIITIIETFVTRLLQLKNEHKRYICLCYGKIDKKRL